MLFTRVFFKNYVTDDVDSFHYDLKCFFASTHIPGPFAFKEDLCTSDSPENTICKDQLKFSTWHEWYNFP